MGLQVIKDPIPVEVQEELLLNALETNLILVLVKAQVVQEVGVRLIMLVVVDNTVAEAVVPDKAKPVVVVTAM